MIGGSEAKTWVVAVLDAIRTLFFYLGVITREKGEQ